MNNQLKDIRLIHHLKYNDLKRSTHKNFSANISSETPTTTRYTKEQHDNELTEFKQKIRSLADKIHKPKNTNQKIQPSLSEIIKLKFDRSQALKLMTCMTI